MGRFHRLLNQRRWRQVRRVVLERDNWRCQCGCGRAGRMEVDHIVPLEQGGAEYDLDNLQILTRSCHIEKTARENRRELTPDEKAWRDYVKEMLPM